MFAAGLIVALFVLGLTLLVRAVQGGFLSRFPLFYGYIIYLLASGVITNAQYIWWPVAYRTGAWFRLLLSFVAEFAVITEISDHVFEPYPAIRRLGRLLTICVSLAFSLLYILPPFLEPQSSREVLIIDLAKRSSLTKGALIIVLLAAVRYYRLPLGANVAGMLMGFSLYLATSVVNFALLEAFGWERYGETFGYFGSLSFTLGLAVWTVALWRYRPAVPVAAGTAAEATGAASHRLSNQLGKANTALIRLLGK